MKEFGVWNLVKKDEVKKNLEENIVVGDTIHKIKNIDKRKEKA